MQQHDNSTQAHLISMQERLKFSASLTGAISDAKISHAALASFVFFLFCQVLCKSRRRPILLLAQDDLSSCSDQSTDSAGCLVSTSWSPLRKQTVLSDSSVVLPGTLCHLQVLLQWQSVFAIGIGGPHLSSRRGSSCLSISTRCMQVSIKFVFGACISQPFTVVFPRDQVRQMRRHDREEYVAKVHAQ